MTEDGDTPQVRLERHGPALVVVVSGDLDVAVAHQPFELVYAYLDDPPLERRRTTSGARTATAGSAETPSGPVESVTVDLTQVPFVDSTGLGGLIRVQQEARRHGLPVTLRGVGQRLRRLLAMTGLDSDFSFDEGPPAPP